MPEPPRHHRVARGFTIVECLLAGVLLALFAGSIATTVAQAGMASRRGEDLRQAAAYLDEIFTRIDMVGPARLMYEGPTQGELDTRFAWSAQFEEETLADVYSIKVTIRWTTEGKVSSIEGYTQLYDPPGATHTTVNWYEF